LFLFTYTINIDLVEVKCNQFHKFSLVCIKKLQWNKLNSLSKQFTSVNKFVSRGYYIPKLIFFHDFPVKVRDAYYITVRIVFEFLRYLMASWRHNCETSHVMKVTSLQRRLWNMFHFIFHYNYGNLSSSSSFFSHVARMPVDRSSCVDELNWCLDGCLLGILSWSSIYPFHTVSVVSTVSVKTSFETVHRWCHHHVLWQVVPQFYHSVAEEILP